MIVTTFPMCWRKASGTLLKVKKKPDTQKGSEVAAMTAKSYRGKAGYSLWKNNCERFATEMLTGIRYSLQVQGLSAAASSAIASSATSASLN